jgi:hypothetical protein
MALTRRNSLDIMFIKCNTLIKRNNMDMTLIRRNGLGMVHLSHHSHLLLLNHRNMVLALLGVYHAMAR